MVIVKEGNLFFAEEKYICHQVNCMGVMGGKLASQVKSNYPEVFRKYVKFCKEQEPLGKCQVVQVKDDLAIVNLFGQYNYGRRGRYTEYDMLEKALIELKSIANSDIALPYNMGCDCAGGDWSIVMSILERVFSDADFNVIVYKLS